MKHSFAPLSATFYMRPTAVVARELLGKTLIRTLSNEIFMGTIAETEAYTSDDEACHAYKGLTKRSAPLFGKVGYTYVYLCYGIHYCLNIVARDVSCSAGGVLLRALWVSETTQGSSIKGPGNLTKKLSITTEHTGIDTTDTASELLVAEGPVIPENGILVTPRIGLSKAQGTLWRFCIKPSFLQPSSFVRDFSSM